MILKNSLKRVTFLVVISLVFSVLPCTAQIDKEEIHTLIRQVLTWSDTTTSFELLHPLTDEKDSLYIGFDLKKHRLNLSILKETGFFSKEFIDNYDKIILTLDKGIKHGEYEPWLVGDLPTFHFANDVNPWCECQEYIDWTKIKFNIIDLNRKVAEMEWFMDEWKGDGYYFRVKKEDGKWKIDYLEGFDYNDAINQEGL